ncbi:MAG: exodeoxyribonuclease III [Candidatus Atribacteria bacterium]|nr:exodeoxyribonuclease III [Candidatus Atribacteria bacterium]
MKIISWNINGFRAIIKKDFKKTINELNPDILCLQEVKATEKQLTSDEINIEGYSYIWNAAERLGYSGTATYYKNSLMPDEIKIGFNTPEFDREGRVICTRYGDIDLYNIYFPNGQRGMDRVDYKIQFYETLLQICDEDHKRGRKIIITGDFNTAHTEIDLANPKENENYSGFLKVERDMITKYLESNFVDVYRYLNPDKVKYTWWTYRFAARARGIGWRIDYFLVSQDLLPMIKNVEILDSIQGSDHCPVVLEI